jgi:hypothetical protein
MSGHSCSSNSRASTRAGITWLTAGSFVGLRIKSPGEYSKSIASKSIQIVAAQSHFESAGRRMDRSVTVGRDLGQDLLPDY